MHSQAKKILGALIAAIAAMVYAPSSQAADFSAMQALTHTWGSKRFDATLWGLALADVDGTGVRRPVFLEEHAIWLGRIEGNTVAKGAEYAWSSYVRGLRIFAHDLDGDGRDEIIVSAVYEDMPSSLVLRHDGTGFVPVMQKIPWHVRIIDVDGVPTLVGQRSTRDDFFSGKIYRLALHGGAVVQGEPLDLPRWADIFDIALCATPDGEPTLVALRGYAPLKGYERRGRKWKKFWSSDTRFGGTMRIVDRTSRPPLQDLPEYHVPVGHEPLPAHLFGTDGMIAVHHDMPLRNIILQKELVKGGRLVGFTHDPAFGFGERFVTERMPGFIADFVIEPDNASGMTKIYVALQNDPEMFNPGRQSSILIYRVPATAAPLPPSDAVSGAHPSSAP